MLGVHARSVAIGWFVVVISIGSLEAGQTVRGPYEATIIGRWGYCPSCQRRSSSSMSPRPPGRRTLTAVKSRRSTAMGRTSCT